MSITSIYLSFDSSAVRIIHCMEDMIDRQQCARENKELLMDFMSAASGDFFNIACGEYNEHTDKCAQLKPLPQVKSLAKKVLNGKNGKQKSAKQSKLINYQTPVFLVMNIFGSLGEDSEIKL